MSSDSEEEFQSADEGSDSEDSQPSQPAEGASALSQKQRSSPLPHSTDIHKEETDSHNDEKLEDEVSDELDSKGCHVPTDSFNDENHEDEVSDELDSKGHHVTTPSATQVEEHLNQNENYDVDKEIGEAEKLSHRNEDTPISTTTCAEDVQECSTSDIDKSAAVDKEDLKVCANSDEKEGNVIKNADQGSSSNDECKGRIPTQVEKIEEKIETSVTGSSRTEDRGEVVFQGESGNETDSLKEGKDASEQLEKVIECDYMKAEVKVEQSQKVEEIQKRDTKEVKEIEEVEHTDHQKKEEMSLSNKTESDVRKEEGKKADLRKMDAVNNSRSKPIRESKIGLKKPRERLGERLGAKKLGSKIEKKTLEGISSDSVRSKESSDETGKSEPKCALGSRKTNQKEKDSINEPIQDELKEQQQRWQEIHQQETGSKNISSEDRGWGGSWGGWGSTIFSAASTFTREVGRGVGTVMETVEGTLGAPDPEALAREMAESERELRSEERCTTSKVEESRNPVDRENLSNITANTASNDDDDGNEKKVADYGISGLSSLGFLVSGVSGALETASSKVLLGGLDTLEMIGQKAMNVIQEGDPGLRKKRAFLSNRKPNLSLILQDARQRAEEESKNQTGDPEKDSKNSQKLTFYQAWEATEGPVHLEALSLVARQCEFKMTSLLQSLPPYLLNELHTANAEIKSACQLDEEQHCEGNLMEQVTNIVTKTGLPLQYEKINTAWSSVEDTTSMIQEAGAVDGPTAERELFSALAAVVVQLSALIHKGAELALITSQADPLTVATHFRELTNTVCGGIEDIADQVCEAITAHASPADADVNNTITNIYLQATSGNSYVDQSMTLLSSVLQYANTKQMASEVS